MNARMPHLIIVMPMQTAQIVMDHLTACAMLGTLEMEHRVMVSIGLYTYCEM